VPESDDKKFIIKHLHTKSDENVQKSDDSKQKSDDRVMKVHKKVMKISDDKV